MSSFIYRTFVRHNSTACVTKFVPIVENYKTLRHIHFPGITSFEKGQKIQEMMVNANLDFKKMESKIRRQQRDVAEQGYKLNDYEEELLIKILQMKPLPTLLTFEFDNVYTGGKKMKQDPLMAQKIAQYESTGCKYHQLERGGQVTWHGNGQLVAYTILDLKSFKNLTVRCFVDSVLLKSVQNLLQKNYSLKSYKNENPGVWMSESNYKIASVGTNIQRAITSYGIGLNVDPDLKYLNSFEMCGLPQTTATSIKKLRPDVEVSIKEVGEQYAKELAKLLNITTVEHMSGEDLEIE
ncbi:Lipoyltransferase (LIP2) [Scheffersomyces stipitis CBS 6054]|uniref:Octanoyltransferase n=1 Tax=Scheffersomyces stipitis (strain ATCC 58785 / CBS 6054 / NBRC 10063 / NRRL Y-11545) TaxID=322104 RepID=A3LXH3_PICST|nr:Lipoyltransferase (LIP2) [Scheffersomyces stipitis CBS 6054]ABN67807.2 Lipoyltransferase (LIP2) [Scheffersomyces stipitis CBS 6054]